MSKDVVKREEMADEDGGSGRRETNSLNGNVNCKCSEFLPMSYVFYFYNTYHIVHVF